MRNKIEIILKPLRAYGIVFVIFFFFIATGERARAKTCSAPRRWNVGRARAFPRLAIAAPNCLVALRDYTRYYNIIIITSRVVIATSQVRAIFFFRFVFSVTRRKLRAHVARPLPHGPTTQIDHCNKPYTSKSSKTVYRGVTTLVGGYLRK